MTLKFKDKSGSVKFLIEDADTEPSDIEKLAKPETEETEETETPKEE